MSINKNRLALILLPFVIFGLYHVFTSRPKNIKAVGELLIDLGVPSGKPIFENFDFKPGDCMTKNFSIKNQNKVDAEPAVKINLTSDLDNLSQALNVDIASNNTLLYSGTLKDDFITLPPLPPSVKTFYEMSICFDPDAGNDYQLTTVVFDLEFGENLDLHPTLPSECSELEGIVNKVITATDKKVLLGTKAPELIIGNEHTEKIKGRSGSDCIIAGPNTEKLYGNSGNDILIGNNLDNKFYGSLGDDKIFGLSGEDKLFGGGGDDYLDGGDDFDKLFGQTGTDKCINGEKLYKCEL